MNSVQYCRSRCRCTHSAKSEIDAAPWLTSVLQVAGSLMSTYSYRTCARMHSAACFNSTAALHRNQLLVSGSRHERRRLRVQAAAAADAEASASAAVKTSTDLAARAAALKTWVGRYCEPWPTELEPVLQNSSGEHCMVAVGPVQMGQVLLQVPEAVFMTANTALKSQLCGNLVKTAELPEWQAMVLHLLCERAAGADSFWAPYTAVLGTQCHHPLLWGSEMQQPLEGSPMLRVLSDRLKQVAEDTEMLIAAGANQLDIAKHWEQQTQTPLVSQGSVCWAAAVLLSRSFQLDMSEPDMPIESDMSYYGSWQAHGPAALALVPWADMLRHSSEAGEEHMLVYDPEARAALLAAHRPYAAGSEVFDSHGPGLSWADLIMDHGCVGEGRQDNPRYDAVLLDHVQPRGSRNAALLEAATTLTGGSPALVLTPTGPDVTCMAAVRAALASDAELIRAGWRTGSKGTDVGLCARVMGRLSVPAALPTERRVLAVLSETVDACLAAYPVGIEENKEELQQLLVQQQQQQARGHAGPSDASSNCSNSVCAECQHQETLPLRIGVLRALISEKTALLGCKATVAGWQRQMDSLAAGVNGSQLPKPDQMAAVYATPT